MLNIIELIKTIDMPKNLQNFVFKHTWHLPKFEFKTEEFLDMFNICICMTYQSLVANPQYGDNLEAKIEEK